MFEINTTALDQFVETHRQLKGGKIICYSFENRISMEFQNNGAQAEVKFYEDGKAQITLETTTYYGENTAEPIKKDIFY